VRSAFGVFVPNFRKLALSEPRSKLDQGGPKPPMNVRDFAVNQLAHQNLGALTNDLRCVEYHAPFGVPPPTTSNRSVCDRLGKARNRTARRLEHNSMTPHKSDRFPGTHFQRPADNPRHERNVRRGKKGPRSTIPSAEPNRGAGFIGLSCAPRERTSLAVFHL